ncbi:MAG: protein kinase [Polyangiaceae bacterium]|nr:protein kinase [Polyangiaceae bacterium]
MSHDDNQVAPRDARQAALGQTVVQSEHAIDDESTADAADVLPHSERLFLRRFTPEEMIAVGGMGELRRHRDRILRRDVVTKSVREDQRALPTVRKRFLREARIQASLQHPCIVPVYDVGNVAKSNVYFTMAHIGGRTLQDVLASLRGGSEDTAKKFSRQRLLDAFCRVCLAIEYAHERGILHRDLKPENIMLGEYGEVYLLDWGVAKRVNDADEENSATEMSTEVNDDESTEDSGIMTAGGSALGTLEYMSPEQFLGVKKTDKLSDVYSLGAILYEILSLAWFREAPSRMELSQLVRKETYEPLPRPDIADIAPGLNDVWRKATQSKPANRYQSARELNDAIITVLEKEREHERVRSAAMEHARAATMEIETQGSSPEEAEARRARALRRLGQALAMDPSLGGALQKLVTNLLDHPSVDVPEVEREVLAAEQKTAVRAFGLSVVTYLAWLALLGIGAAALGVLSHTMFWLMTGCVASLVFYNGWIWYKKRYERKHMLAIMVLAFAAVALTSTFLGPLVLLPSLATATFATFAITMRSDSNARNWGMLFSVAVVLGPTMLQFAGIIPRSYVFDNGHLVMVPGLVRLPTHYTELLLLIIALVTVLVVNVHVRQVVQLLSKSERTALIQAHRLKHLLPNQTTHSEELPPSKRSSILG